MKKRLTSFVLLFLILSATVSGQVSKEKYIRAVGYLNCKIIKHVLTQFPDQLKEYEQFSCEKEFSFEETKYFLEIRGGHNETIALSHEIQGLTKEYNQAWKVDETVNFLSEGVFNSAEKYPKLFYFADKRKADRIGRKPNLPFAIFINDLKSDLRKLLESDGQKSPTPTPTPSPGLSSELVLKDMVPYIIIIILSLAVLLLLAWIIYLRRLIESNRLPARENPERNLRDVIKKHGKDIENIRSELQAIKKSRVGTSSLSVAQGIEIAAAEVLRRRQAEEEDLKGTTFYLSNPNEDGTFNDSSASASYKPAASIYKFTKSSDGRAQFEIDSNELAIKLALRNPNRAIDPVCEPQNLYNPNAQKIITERNGIAILEGDKWIVKVKAHIRYQ